MSDSSPTTTPRYLDALGHVGYVFLLVGVWAVGEKIELGWVGYIAGLLIWAFIGWKLRMSSMIVWQLIAVANAAWAWWKW